MFRLTITWRPSKLDFLTVRLYFKTIVTTKDKATIEVIIANIIYSSHQHINFLLLIKTVLTAE